MHKVINNKGNIIAYVDVPRYIKQSSNGSFVETSFEDAQGISIKSEPYHILGRESFTEIDTGENIEIEDVLVEKIDGGEVTFENESNVLDLSDQITTIQEWVIEKTLEEDLSGLGLEDIEI